MSHQPPSPEIEAQKPPLDLSGALVSIALVEVDETPVALHNTINHLPSGQKLIIPDQKQIEKKAALTGGKVRYISPDTSHAEGLTGLPEYTTTCVHPAARDAVKQFGPEILFRAVMVSMNGSIPPEHLASDWIREPVKDVAALTKTGYDQLSPRDTINMEPFGEGFTYVPEYVATMAAIRAELDPDVADAVFPALLVYSKEAMEYSRLNHSEYRFSGGTNPAEALRSVYILPAEALWT